MPIQETLLKMSLYVSLVLIMPGPTNTLLLSSGLKVGVRRTRHLVMAEALGYVIAISLWGSSCARWRPAGLAPGCHQAAELGLHPLPRGQDVDEKPGTAACRGRPRGFPRCVRHHVDESEGAAVREHPVSARSVPVAAYFAWAMAVFLIVLAPIGIGWSYLGVLLTSRRAWAPHTPAAARRGAGAAHVLGHAHVFDPGPLSGAACPTGRASESTPRRASP